MSLHRRSEAPSGLPTNPPIITITFPPHHPQIQLGNIAHSTLEVEEIFWGSFYELECLYSF